MEYKTSNVAWQCFVIDVDYGLLSIIMKDFGGCSKLVSFVWLYIFHAERRDSRQNI